MFYLYIVGIAKFELRYSSVVMDSLSCQFKMEFIILLFVFSLIVSSRCKISCSCYFFLSNWRQYVLYMNVLIVNVKTKNMKTQS